MAIKAEVRSRHEYVRDSLINLTCNNLRQIEIYYNYE
nr:MAG TPA: hypothetical protein [Caudoviricetes sp.]